MEAVAILAEMVTLKRVIFSMMEVQIVPIKIVNLQLSQMSFNVAVVDNIMVIINDYF